MKNFPLKIGSLPWESGKWPVEKQDGRLMSTSLYFTPFHSIISAA
jgi:hypothetical protein